MVESFGRTFEMRERAPHRSTIWSIYEEYRRYYMTSRNRGVASAQTQPQYCLFSRCLIFRRVNSMNEEHSILYIYTCRSFDVFLVQCGCQLRMSYTFDASDALPQKLPHQCLRRAASHSNIIAVLWHFLFHGFSAPSSSISGLLFQRFRASKISRCDRDGA